MRLSRHIIIWAAVFAVAIGVTLLAAHTIALRVFMAETETLGRDAVDRHVEEVRSWLDVYQAMPAIYARAPDIRDILRPEAGADARRAVSAKLEILNATTGAADTYLLDQDGFVIAASNWSDPKTFVGKNFSFRPYFEAASQGRLGRYFALGSTSGERGYFFSSPVRLGVEVAGVVVVKVGVDEIEQKMRLSPHEVFVTDDDGVILLAGHPEWRLGSFGDMPPAVAARIRNGDQFYGAGLERADLTLASGEARAPEDGEIVTAVADLSDAPRLEFLHLSAPMTIEGWTIHVLIGTAEARAQALTSTLFAASVLAAFGFGVAAIWQRRRRLIEGIRTHERAQVALERTVAARTADLRRVNRELEAEIVERSQAEKDLRQAQDELIQAGKLAALGQMSAALSHEFNQPLAAIRSYAENAIAFLNNEQLDPAEENLERITRLTQRMAELSKLMLNFSRRPRDAVLPVDLADVIDEAMNLLTGRFGRSGVEPVIERPDGPIPVMGGHIRLQHVVMNLLTNAIDALEGRDDPMVRIDVLVDQDVTVVVSDNGPGIAAEALPKIFDPFFTTKDVGKGLGLGLSISFNIVKDFGGSLRGENPPEGGARFILTLRRAETLESAAE